MMDGHEDFVDMGVQYTPIHKVFAERKGPQQYLGGNVSTRTILCQTCVIQIMMGTITDFRLISREYARVIKV